MARDVLDCLQTPQKFLNEPVEDLQQRYVIDELEEEEEGDYEIKGIEENPQGTADSPGTNINVPVHVNEISTKPQSISKEAVRLTKGARKAEVLTSSHYKRKLEEVQENKTQKQTKTTEQRKTSTDVCP
jgi:hypothetical protein